MVKFILGAASILASISCSSLIPKSKTTASEDKAPVENPSDNGGSTAATKVYNCTAKRGNVEILCSRYTISDDLV